MNRSHFLGIVVFFCVGVSGRLAAQSLDSLDAEARRVFDLPGPTSLDPDETFEYLDELSTLTGDTLERLHSHPDLSWTEARRALLTHRSGSILHADSSARFSLQSRGSAPLSAEDQKGYASGEYLGGPEAVYNRIRARSTDLEVSALEQKASWEPSYTDHLTGFAELHNPVPIGGNISLEKAVAGDYALAFGSGLMFGGGLASSKAIHAGTAIEERDFGLRGTVNSSARSFLGGAAELSAGPSNIFLFASDRTFDAKVASDTIDTIYSSTSHATESQLATEGAGSARMLGARVELKTSDTAALYLKGGITAYDLHYNNPYIGTANVPFIGQELGMAGADLLALSGAWTGIAEAAMSSNDTSRKGSIFVSMIFEPADRVAFSVAYRHIPYRFVSPFGELSGESASTFSNFEGYYFGLQIVPIADKLRLSVSSQIENELIPLRDLFGKQRHDYLVSAQYHVSKPLELTATVRDQENATLADSSGTGYVTLEGQTLNARLELSYHPQTNAALNTRYERIYYGLASLSQDSSQQGWLLSEEAQIKAPGLKSEFTITATRFQTTSSISSLWSYEQQTPGRAIYNPLAGLGWRVGLRAKVHATSSFACSAYLAGTIYDEPRTIGSGLTARTGTSDFSVTVQLDVNL